MLDEIASPMQPIDGTLPFQVTRRRTVPDEYSHILIPTSLQPHERHALLMGLQLASAMLAKVTLLHVLPVPEIAAPDADPKNSWHWLDAIDNLHGVLSSRPALQQAEQSRKQLDKSRKEVEAFVHSNSSVRLQSIMKIDVQCIEGDVGDEILRFASEQSVDLVILSSTLSRWGLPIVPSRVHRMLHQIHKRVLVVHLDAADLDVPQRA